MRQNIVKYMQDLINSKYINKDKYNLNYCKVLSMNYEIKKRRKQQKMKKKMVVD